jgi:ferric-dicitrate binding protein FerR (iron transport regulator)
VSFDAELRRALAPLAGDPERDARRVLAALDQATRPRLRPYWFPLLLAAAALAGFALGFLLRPEPEPPATGGPRVAQQTGGEPVAAATRPLDPVAGFGPQLIVATGPVRRTGDAAKPVPIGTRFALGDEIETSSAAKAAIALPCGSLLLANRGTRVAFPAPRQLELRRGHVLVDATKGENPLVVRGSQGQVVLADPGEVDIRSDERELAVTAVNDVTVRLETNDGVHRRVLRGQTAWIHDEAIRDPRTIEGPIYTAQWTFDLLVPAGRTAEAD